jgi:hypothetical protein
VHDLAEDDEASFVGRSRELRAVYWRQFARERASERLERW